MKKRTMAIARGVLVGIGACLSVSLSSLAGAQVLETAMTIAWAEGPVVDAAGNVYVSDVRTDRIMRLGADGSLSTFRFPANNPNGMVIDRAGRLVVCESGDPRSGKPPRITRTDLATGREETLVDNFEGLRIKAPNDITIDGQGRLYFTSDERPFFLPQFSTAGVPGVPAREVPVVGVYRIDVDGKVRRILEAPRIHRPNGIMLSPDDRTLYLIENDIAQGGLRQLLAFDLAQDGFVGAKRLLRDFSPGRSGDGMAIDVEGNLYVAAGLNALRGTQETLDTRAGIHVLSPDGASLRFIPVPEDTVSNIAFGGADMKTAYVTAGKTIFKFRNDIAGLPR